MSPQYEEVIARFEDAWRAGRKPSIAAILRESAAGDTESVQRSLAIELVKVDLEYRWRAARARGRTTALRLEAYTKKLPILGPPGQLPLDLIAEEYRVRRRIGDAPDAEDYLARFTHPRSELAAALDAVNRELDEEGDPLATQSLPARRPLQQTVDPAAPLFYGDYVLKRQIGTGGLCRVYAGVQLSIRKEVALKVLRRRFWSSAEAVSRFLREAQIVSKLPPEGIVGIHGLGRLPRGGYFMVMDLVDGQDLRARRNAGDVSPEQAAGWVAAAAEIVGRVHAAGFIHGDLKPANILVEYGGQVLLTDFGFARDLGPAEFPRRAGAIGGTPAFLAPELASDTRQPVRPAIDVFGLGGVLFWLLTGQAVHVEKKSDQLPAMLAEPTWDAKVCERMLASVPAGLTDLSRRCLARNPADRPTVGEVLEECCRFTAPPNVKGA